MSDSVKHRQAGLTVSIVSHGHGEMVWLLIDQLLSLPEPSQIILTLNIPESIPAHVDPRVSVVRNSNPKGFGANHNSAFERCADPYFCVVNPDIELMGSPFPSLLDALRDEKIGVAAPLVLSATGQVEDSARRFMTPGTMLLRVLGVRNGAYALKAGSVKLFPDWVAGMFMLFNSAAYRQVGGFDDAYFMYCEDADICTRLWRRGSAVVICPDASVIHQAQRASRKNRRHLCWHVASLMRYFARYWGRLPRSVGSL